MGCVGVVKVWVVYVWLWYGLSMCGYGMGCVCVVLVWVDLMYVWLGLGCVA
jgi:hypothetical protein